MPLTEPERKITRAVVQRFIDENQPTTRMFLLKEFKGAALQALDRLVNFAVLKVVAGEDHVYLPRALAFHYCGDASTDRFGKDSLELVLHALRRLIDQDLERGEFHDHTSDEVLTIAQNLTRPLRAFRSETIRIGIYLAEEFGVVTGLQRNPQQTEITRFRVGERILTMDDIPNVWDKHIRQYGARIESGEEKSLDRDPATNAATTEDTEAERSQGTVDVSVPDGIPETSDQQPNTPTVDVAATRPERTKSIVEVAVRALSDKRATVDLLEFGDYAHALIDLIQSPKTQTPLTIGIDGAWGSGKTTLMGMIKDRLDSERTEASKEAKAHTVWFNAWKYDREESLWAALALEILSQIRKQVNVYERAKLWLALNWMRLDTARLLKGLAKSIVYPSVAILVAVGYIYFWSAWISPAINFQKVAAILASGGVLSFLAIAAKKIQDKVIKPFDLNISEYVRTPDYKQRVGFQHHGGKFNHHCQ